MGLIFSSSPPFLGGGGGGLVKSLFLARPVSERACRLSWVRSTFQNVKSFFTLNKKWTLLFVQAKRRKKGRKKRRRKRLSNSEKKFDCNKWCFTLFSFLFILFASRSRNQQNRIHNFIFFFFTASDFKTKTLICLRGGPS